MTVAATVTVAVTVATTTSVTTTKGTDTATTTTTDPAHERAPHSVKSAAESTAAPAWPSLQQQLRARPTTWLVTGAAGFIGSHLLEVLLQLDQWVLGFDNLSTGFRHNLDQVLAAVGAERARRFEFIEGDLCDGAACARALRHPAAGTPEYVLHQAALGSVPRSLEDPLATHASNVTGFLQLLLAARAARVSSFVYASSSSVYGDHPALPKVEDCIGAPLSPYAAGKFTDEVYAAVSVRDHSLQATGLRYFNVFGPRQDPDGAYAAVIPRWTSALLRGEPVWINGDGQTSRDFCHVSNAVQANLLAAMRNPALGAHRVYNVAVGERTTLLELFGLLRDGLQAYGVPAGTQAQLRDFRAGDVRHSLADISRARTELGFEPSHRLAEGIAASMPWYAASLGFQSGSSIPTAST